MQTQIFDLGYPQPLAGVDEVGRGPLAGPVVACALILPEGCKIEGVRDSKKLSQKLRQTLEKKILDAAVSFCFGVICAFEIDKINILAATLKAMQIAIEGLTTVPKTILIDGDQAPPSPNCIMLQINNEESLLSDFSYDIICIKKGDSISQSIAAASILAKEYRDRLMDELHEEYPLYGFSSHKGYGTKKHFEAISKHGLCPLHRRTFIKNAQIN